MNATRTLAVVTAIAPVLVSSARAQDGIVRNDVGGEARAIFRASDVPRGELDASSPNPSGDIHPARERPRIWEGGMSFIQRMVILLLFTMLAPFAAQASCSDRPGTPDQVTAEPLSATAVRLHWRNTTSKAGGSDDMWFDIYVLNDRNQPIGKNITGGAGQRGVGYHQMSSVDINGLQPDVEYRFQMRARTGAGTAGCVSGQPSNMAATRTPSAQLDGACQTYANTALRQFAAARDSARTAACQFVGPRWSDDRQAHYAFCVGNRASPVIGSEQKGRDNEISACRTNATKIVRLRQNITTPSGTALGGWAELELHSDGVYFFRGHMHDSGAEGYSFTVRAAMSSKSGIALVAAKSGNVQGTSTLIKRRRDFNWNDQGRNALLVAEWDNVATGTLQVAKAYKGNITGGLKAIATDLLTFVVTDVAFGPQTAMVVFLSNEATAATGSGGFGELVFAGRLAWMVSPTYAIPVFIGEKVAADNLIKHRSPTAQEYAFARSVFGDTLPPAGKVTLTNLGGKDNRAFVVMTPDGSIQMNLTNRVFTAPGGPMRAVGPNRNGDVSYPVPGELFIHELTHAWQLAHRGPSPYQWIIEGVTSSNYHPKPANQPWRDNNIEQQATIVNEWFGNHAEGWVDQADLGRRLEVAEAVRDPYFRFIKDNIRLGQP